jgi:hypothetical protein
VGLGLKGVKLCRENKLGDAGAITAAEGLPGLQQLKKLNLNGNGIGSAGAIAVARAAAELSLLRTLVLRSNNGFSDRYQLQPPHPPPPPSPPCLLACFHVSCHPLLLLHL